MSQLVLVGDKPVWFPGNGTAENFVRGLRTLETQLNRDVSIVASWESDEITLDPESTLELVEDFSETKSPDSLIYQVGIGYLGLLIFLLHRAGASPEITDDLRMRSEAWAFLSTY